MPLLEQEDYSLDDIDKEIARRRKSVDDEIALRGGKAMPEARAKKPEKNEGIVRGLTRDVGGGLADLGEMYGRGIRAMPGGAEAGKGEGVGGGIISSAKDIKEQYDLNPKERTGISRWIHGGVRAATTSLAAGAPGALAGIAATSWIPIPGARLVGGIIGYAVGGATLFGVAEYDSTLEEALKAGVDPEKAETAAIRNGLFEGGFEFAADILEGMTMGAGRVVTAPAKVALKDGIKSMFKVGAKQAIKRGAGVAAIETGSEMLTAGLQTEEYYKLGLTKQRFYDAAAEAFGPAFVASLIFGGMAEGGLQLNRRRLEKVLKDPDAKPEERMAVVNEVYEKILPVDKEMAEQWKESATAAVNNNEAIPTDEALESDKELEGAVEDREAAAEKLQEQAPSEKAKAPSNARETLLDETEQTVTAKELLTGKKEPLAAEEFVGDESIEAEEAAAGISGETLEKAIGTTEKVTLPKEPVTGIEAEAEVEAKAETAIDEGAQEAATSSENKLPEPTEAQIESGNYKKGHIKVQGLDISVENPEGSIRSGVSPEGKKWSATMSDSHYGYFKRSEGQDGEQIDVFVNAGDRKQSDKAYIVDQVDPETGKFDEHKVMMGYPSIEAAKKGYLANYEKGWKGLGNITEASIEDLKAFTEKKQTKPYAEIKKAAVPKKAKIKAEEPVAPEKVEIPTFTDTTQATTFGKKATPEQITELKKLRKEAEARYYVLAEEGKQDEADKEALKTQLYREAFEAKEKVEKEVVPEKIEEKKSYKMTLAEIHKKPDILMSLELKQLHEHKARTLGFEKAGRSFTEGYLKKLAEVAGKTDMPAAMTVYEALSAYKKGDITQASLAAEKILGKLHKAEKEALTSDKISEMHKKDIQQALKEGKPVPKEVLAEYPDLAPAKPAISKPAKAKPSEALKEEIKGEGIVEGAPKVEKAKTETTLEKKEAEKVSEFEGIDLSKITVEVESIRAKTGEIVKVTKNAETAMKEIDSDIEKMYAVLNCL